MWLDALKSMKEKSNLTAAEIAAGAGVPKPTLEKILSGETKDPRLPTMRKIVYFLGYKLEDLYKDENAPTSSEDDAEALSVSEVGKTLVNVAYTYIPNQKRFYVEPHDETVGIIEEQPTVIRPE